MKPTIAALVLVLALTGCTATASPIEESAPVAKPDITPAYDASQIRETATQTIPLGGVSYTVTSYENDAYSCGRTGVYPFVVVEQAGRETEELPVWAMLHGGGTGWYDESGIYVGDESNNDAESATSLLAMIVGYVGFAGTNDTFLGDRIRAGDRVALGSLCDHDLMMGLGQPYPNNPHGGTASKNTVDGLLANLAMLEFVTSSRPTSSTWIAGQSAGSYGAWALAHNLWKRGMPPAGVILDSGLLSERSFDLFEAGIGREYYEFDADAMAEKHGPYFTDPSLYAENAIAAGFDVPLFDIDVQGDPGCGGNAPAIGAATADGFGNNCDWLNSPLAEAIAAHGDPVRQRVKVYPGSGHIVTTTPGPIQADLRDWFASL